MFRLHSHSLLRAGRRARDGINSTTRSRPTGARPEERRPIFEPLEDRRLLSVAVNAAAATPVSLDAAYTGALKVHQGHQPATKQTLTLNVTSSSGGTFAGTISAPAIGADTFTGTINGRAFTLNFSGDETGTVTGRIGKRGAVLAGSLNDQTDGSAGRFRLKASPVLETGAPSQTGAGARALLPGAIQGVSPTSGIGSAPTVPPGVGNTGGGGTSGGSTGTTGTGSGTGTTGGTGSTSGNTTGSTTTGNGTAGDPAAPVPSMVGAFNGQFNGSMTGGNTSAGSGGTVNFGNGPHNVTLSVDSQDPDGGFTGTMSIQDLGDFPIQGYIGFPVASEVRIILVGGNEGSGALKGKLTNNNQVLFSIRRPFTVATQGVTLQGQVTLNRVSSTPVDTGGSTTGTDTTGGTTTGTTGGTTTGTTGGTTGGTTTGTTGGTTTGTTGGTTTGTTSGTTDTGTATTTGG